MSLNKTRYGRKRVLDHFFGRIAYPFPGAVYFALFTEDPTDLGLQDSEIDHAGYARVEIVSKMGNADPVSGVISNSAEIEWPPALEDWPEITHLGAMDAPTGGNMIYFGPAVTSRTVPKNDSFKLKIGQVTIQER